MEKMLSARLLRVAKSIPKCRSLADCGCDHGYISIYAAGHGIAESVTASDINRGPLSRAEKEIAAAGLENRITTVLTDGLDGLAPHECVVIAGMGGEMISDIISRAEWTKDNCTLVLQPMSRAEILREDLYKAGFEITEESFVEDGNHLYCIMVVKYGGERRYELYEKYISCAGLGSELAAEYIDKILSRLRYEYERKSEAKTLTERDRKVSGSYIESLSEVRKTL